MRVFGLRPPVGAGLARDRPILEGMVIASGAKRPRACDGSWVASSGACAVPASEPDPMARNDVRPSLARSGSSTACQRS